MTADHAQKQDRAVFWYGCNMTRHGELIRTSARLLEAVGVAAEPAGGREPVRGHIGPEIFQRQIGLLRFIVVGDTDAEAEAIAQRAYPKWHDCYDHLFRKAGLVHERGEKTGKFETAFGGENGGVRGIHGSPQTVTRKLQAQAEIAGVNYLVGQFAFGDVTDTEVIKGVELFQRQVMPALKDMNTNM